MGLNQWRRQWLAAGVPEPQVSRSGLDRCLRRHGVGKLRDLQAQSPRPQPKAFNAYAPGYLQVDVKYLPQMADGEADQKTVRGTVFPPNARRTLFVAIDPLPGR